MSDSAIVLLLISLCSQREITYCNNNVHKKHLQLRFIMNVVQPFFSQGNKSDDYQLVLKNRRIHLWIN